MDTGFARGWAFCNCRNGEKTMLHKTLSCLAVNRKVGRILSIWPTWESNALIAGGNGDSFTQLAARSG
jgi:hypothetical protein